MCVCVFVRCHKLLFVMFSIGQSSEVCTKSCVELRLRLGLKCLSVLLVVIITPRISCWTSSGLLLITCREKKEKERKTAQAPQSFATVSAAQPVNPAVSSQVSQGRFHTGTRTGREATGCCRLLTRRRSRRRGEHTSSVSSSPMI